MALKNSKSYENCSFRSKKRVYFTTIRFSQQHLTFHPILFVNIHGTVQYEYFFFPTDTLKSILYNEGTFVCVVIESQ